MLTISITRTVRQGKPQIAVVCPYHPVFPNRAKALGGRFSAEFGAGGTWYFDPRDEPTVRALLQGIFGDDGSNPGDVLTIRARSFVLETLMGNDKEYWLAGRQVARVTGRDSGAKLGPGIVLLSGGFYSSGSMKYPTVKAKDGTVVEIRDVPRAAAERTHDEYHGVTLLDAEGHVVREATSKDDPEFAQQAELDLLEVVEKEHEEARNEVERRRAELADAENRLVAAEGRLAGTRMRLAKIAKSA